MTQKLMNHNIGFTTIEVKSPARSNYSQVAADIKKMKELYKENPTIEYSFTDNWVRVGGPLGETFNGFSRERANKILGIKEEVKDELL